MRPNTQIRKTVVVHRGARDAYQVAASLAESGLLECLITDLYWPHDQKWASRWTEHLAPSVSRITATRSNSLVPSRLVKQTLICGMLSHVLDKIPQVPFPLRRRATRWTDAVMGNLAGAAALKTRSMLLAYSYYGFDAFESYGGPGMLFQAHPHPSSVRDILQRELNQHPECAESLNKEWELSLPQEDFDRLVAEPRIAAHCLVASSFTRQTLTENGVSKRGITVIPYGVDLMRFRPSASRRKGIAGRLKLLFVGTINQRKGIKYLLEAAQLINSDNIELTVCGRVVDDLTILRRYGGNIIVRPSVRADELVEAYRSSDLFVFPSVAEGFGQVLLESLACGLPILSTNRTAAPDLIQEGVEGFVVEACRPELLAEKIEWCLTNRRTLCEMRERARERAELFTWERFRKRVLGAVVKFQSESQGVGLNSEVEASC